MLLSSLIAAESSLELVETRSQGAVAAVALVVILDEPSQGLDCFPNVRVVEKLGRLAVTQCL